MNQVIPEFSCSSCQACCCKLEVLLMGDDNVPVNLSCEDTWGGSVMQRLDDGWCIAVDRNTLKCRIYERRPGVCREYATGDPECLGERSRAGIGEPAVILGCLS
jgi:Fe-S-cluster containining protein